MDCSGLIIYLDDASKSMIKTNISTFASKGIVFISTFAELTKEMLDKCNKVVILEGAFHALNCLSDLKLFKSLYGLEYLFLSNSDYLIGCMEEIATCYKCDITTLNYEMIQAAVFGDKALESKKESDCFDSIVKCAKEKVLREDTTPEDAMICNAFLSLAQLDGGKDSEINRLREENSVLQNECLRLKKDNKMLLSGYKGLIYSANKLNKTLKEYEVTFTQNIYQKLNLNNYNDKPMIIYLKEYEEILNFEELIETIYNSFKVQQKKSVKVLRLYDNSGNRKISVLPEQYKILSNKYLIREVLANDFVCKSGDYVKILDIILQNKVNLDVLIIVDCKDHNDVVLSGTVLQLNLCRNKEHLEKLGLFKQNTIITGDQKSNPELLCWDHYDVSGMDNNEKFLYLSSRPVIKKILELSYLFEESL